MSTEIEPILQEQAPCNTHSLAWCISACRNQDECEFIEKISDESEVDNE